MMDARVLNGVTMEPMPGANLRGVTLERLNGVTIEQARALSGPDPVQSMGKSVGIGLAGVLFGALAAFGITTLSLFTYKKTDSAWKAAAVAGGGALVLGGGKLVATALLADDVARAQSVGDVVGQLEVLAFVESISLAAY